MAQIFPFTPNAQQAPTFQPTLDGQVCTCTVRWNLFNQAYWLQCVGANGQLVFNMPVVESPPAMAIDTMVWDPLALSVEVTTRLPHGLKFLDTVNLTIVGSSPSAYNGDFQVFVDSATTFRYPQPNDPGALIAPGRANFFVSLSAPWFSTKIIFRSNQFHIL